MFSPPYCYSVPINRKAVKYMTLTVITEGLLKLLEANRITTTSGFTSVSGTKWQFFRRIPST